MDALTRERGGGGTGNAGHGYTRDAAPCVCLSRLSAVRVCTESAEGNTL